MSSRIMHKPLIGIAKPLSRERFGDNGYWQIVMTKVKVSSKIMHKPLIGIVKPLSREMLWLNIS